MCGPAGGRLSSARKAGDLCRCRRPDRLCSLAGRRFTVSRPFRRSAARRSMPAAIWCSRRAICCGRLRCAGHHAAAGSYPSRKEPADRLRHRRRIGGCGSDAARAACGCGSVRLPGDTLAAIALKLGADVPMCLASRPLIARGIGEEIEPVGSPVFSDAARQSAEGGLDAGDFPAADGQDTIRRSILRNGDWLATIEANRATTWSRRRASWSRRSQQVSALVEASRRDTCPHVRIRRDLLRHLRDRSKQPRLPRRCFTASGRTGISWPETLSGD